MKKRFFALFLATAMIFALSACGGSVDTSSTASANVSSATGDKDPLGLRNGQYSGVTLTRLIWYTPGQEEKAMVKDFEEKTGCTVKDVIVDFENYDTQISTMMAAGEPVDIGTIYGAMFPANVIANMYLPIDKYINKAYSVDKNNIDAGGFDFTKMANYMWNNHYYGFCSYYDVDMLVLYYNKKMFSESGIKTPTEMVKDGTWNLDTFYQAAFDLTEEKKQYGFSSGGDNKGGADNAFVGAYGTQFVKYDSNGQPSENLSDSNVLSALNFIQKMFYGAGAVASADGFSFKEGKAAMCIDGLYLAPKLMASDVPDSVKNNWDIVPIPLAKTNTTGAYPTDWLKATGVVRGSKNVDAAAAFALFKSAYKCDNTYDEIFTDEQKELVKPLYVNINFANCSYGSAGDTLSQMMGSIKSGGDISQLVSENKSVVAAQISKVLSGE